MKIIVFLILLYSVGFAQITVVGDTTDLKNTHGSGVVLLEQFGGGNLNGGGFFRRIDSTYAEGVHAFDHPSSGKQWARINLTDQFLPRDVSAEANNNEILWWQTDKFNFVDIAGIDSFYTTSAVDTIPISGVEAGDIFVFAEYTPDYDPDIDTVTYSYQSKEDTVFVSRSGGSAYKSNGKYSYMRLK